MVLAGTYADMRDFIYQLETAPEFVVIDNVQLAEGGDGSGSLVVTLDLSTYYRDDAVVTMPSRRNLARRRRSRGRGSLLR